MNKITMFLKLKMYSIFAILIIFPNCSYAWENPNQDISIGRCVKGECSAIKVNSFEIIKSNDNAELKKKISKYL